MDTNYFEKLSAINVNGKTEKKGGLIYLSWAYAWGELKKAFPRANYTVYENASGLNYHTDGSTAWVKVGVSVPVEGGDLEHVEYLPVMDSRNKSIPLKGITSFDVNKAIQRALTKAIARHGIGLYIYAGEDLPEDAVAEAPKPTQQAKTKHQLAKDWLDRQPQEIVRKAIGEYGADGIEELAEEQLSGLMHVVKNRVNAQKEDGRLTSTTR